MMLKEPFSSRLAAGHTQEQACTLLGVSRRTWEEWESSEAPALIPAFMIVPQALAAIPVPLFWSAATLADFSGTVVAIHDGDTLTVLVDRKQVKVRIADIDAPEAKQPFGTWSRQALATLCHQKPAQVIDKGLDRYGRTIGVVSCAGWDAATEQVRAGMAWVFTRWRRQNGEGRMALREMIVLTPIL
jgi:endonuclease YncB( thermonuclease family)